jgi:hypothetical protein
MNNIQTRIQDSRLLSLDFGNLSVALRAHGISS